MLTCVCEAVGRGRVRQHLPAAVGAVLNAAVRTPDCETTQQPPSLPATRVSGERKL